MAETIRERIKALSFIITSFLAILSEFQAAAEACYIKARPLDNTDFVMNWRKQMARQYTLRALQELAVLD